MISTEPRTDPRLELVASLVLQRAHGTEAAKFDQGYSDWGLPTPGHLTGAFDELTAAARCGRAFPAEGLTVTNGSAGPLCMACVDGIASDSDPRETP